MADPNYSSQANYAAQTLGNIQGMKNSAVPVPRTIASAIGRVDGLNERLASARIQLTKISEQIGGLRECSEGSTKDSPPSESNAVCRLNDSAERAHECMSDIESLLGCIGRALG
jgi:hypothetical protein